jgi:hypothetical protein
MALLAAAPTRRAILASLALALLSVVLFPRWPIEWWYATKTAAWIMSRSTCWRAYGGCISALRWKRAEPRLLAALAPIPHTPPLYDAVPLFLIPTIFDEGLFLSGQTVVWKIGLNVMAPYPSLDAAFAMSDQLMSWVLYVPFGHDPAAAEPTSLVSLSRAAH